MNKTKDLISSNNKTEEALDSSARIDPKLILRVEDSLDTTPKNGSQIGQQGIVDDLIAYNVEDQLSSGASNSNLNDYNSRQE